MQLKLNWLSYTSYVACQPLGHSKCGKICDTDNYNKQTREILTFKPEGRSFYTKEVSYINFFPKQIDQTFGLWAGQSLKLRRNTCFRGFKFSLPVNYHAAKAERLALSKMWTSIFCLSKPVHMTTTSGQSPCGIEYNFRYLKWFFSKLPHKSQLVFLLKLWFLKIRLLVTWLKCLI